MMDEQIKNIVAQYIKVPVALMDHNTVIDRTAVSSSILLHRMYAHLAKEGIIVSDYWDIKNLGNLLQKISGQSVAFKATEFPTDATFEMAVDSNAENLFSIGIDMEQISLLPVVTDYREDKFYSMNFAPSEIAYCVLQASPVASFAGLFAAKEAIVKADNSYVNNPFSSIIIDHSAKGEPIHLSFQLSISHTSDIAVAIAITKYKSPSLTETESPKPTNYSANNRLLHLLAFAALIVSLLSFLLHFLHK